MVCFPAVNPPSYSRCRVVEEVLQPPDAVGDAGLDILQPCLSLYAACLEGNRFLAPFSTGRRAKQASRLPIPPRGARLIFH